MPEKPVSPKNRSYEKAHMHLSLRVPIILSGTRSMINAHRYWFSSSPFQSIPFIYLAKPRSSLSEWKRRRIERGLGILEFCSLSTDVQKRFLNSLAGESITHTPEPLSLRFACLHMLSSAGWLTHFSLDNNTSTNHRENRGQKSPILLVIHRNTDCRGESSASPSLEEKSRSGTS